MKSFLSPLRAATIASALLLAACTSTTAPGPGGSGTGGTGAAGSGRGGAGGSGGAGTGGAAGTSSGGSGSPGGSGGSGSGGSGGSAGSGGTAGSSAGSGGTAGSGGSGGSGGTGTAGGGGAAGQDGAAARDTGGETGGGEVGPAADTWQSFALPFMVKYCASCHNDDNTGDASRNYRMLAVVMREKIDIACGVAKSQADRAARNCPANAPRANQFPAGNGPKPTNDERDRLLRWIDRNTP